MDGRTLETLLKRIQGKLFGGVYASDELSYLNPARRTFYIVNTHPRNQPGEHWLALTLEEEGVATFFDAYGYPPDFNYYPQTILAFLEKHSRRIFYHNDQLQNELSVTCGQHCMFYLIQRGCGLSYKNVLACYSGDTLKNDAMVSAFVRQYQTCTTNVCAGQQTCSFEKFKKCHCL